MSKFEGREASDGSGNSGNRYSAAGKAEAVREFEASGLGVVAYGREHGYNTKSFIRWRREYAEWGEAGLEAKPNSRNTGGRTARVEMHERLCVLRGEAPLVLAHDGGSENVKADVAAWAERRRVILLRSRPQTPQHNPWVERKHGEVRGVSGLRSGTVLSSIAEGTSRFDSAVRVLDQCRLRRRNGWRTAAERDRDPRVRYSPGRREALWLAVRAAEEEAMRSCESARDRPLAVREAKLRGLEEYGVLFRTRGGVPYWRGDAEFIS